MVFLLGGGVVGVAAVLLALAADWAGRTFESVSGRMPLAVLVLTPWASRHHAGCPGATFQLWRQRHPQVIAARQLHGLAARERMVSMRVAVGTHVMIGSNDLERARGFYDATLGTLGGKPGEMDVRGRLIYAHDGGRLMITTPINGDPATAANGGITGVAAANREHVPRLAQGGHNSWWCRDRKPAC